MSSNIKLKRICHYCNKEFTARTTVTKYCSDNCSKRAYKARKREEKIEESNIKARQIIEKPFQDIKTKEFLTVKDTAQLLNCSIRTTYRLIENGTLKAINLATRKTIIRRQDIDKLFDAIESVEEEKRKAELLEFNMDECYTIGQIVDIYGVSSKALNDIVKRNNLPKFQCGKFVYIPKLQIDELLT